MTSVRKTRTLWLLELERLLQSYISTLQDADASTAPL